MSYRLTVNHQFPALSPKQGQKDLIRTCPVTRPNMRTETNGYLLSKTLFRAFPNLPKLAINVLLIIELRNYKIYEQLFNGFTQFTNDTTTRQQTSSILTSNLNEEHLKTFHILKTSSFIDWVQSNMDCSLIWIQSMSLPAAHAWARGALTCKVH